MRGRTFSDQTALLGILRQLLRECAEKGTHREGPYRFRDADPKLTRRGFLAGVAVASTGLGNLAACSRAGPTIAIVGAGLAGLHVAYLLRKAGIVADIYEAADRVGGRVYTLNGFLGPNITSEAGGEFIGTQHSDLLKLIQEFELKLLDRGTASGITPAYFAEGSFHSESQIADEFRGIASRIAADAALLKDVGLATTAGSQLARLDNTPLSEYLDQLDCRGWLRALIDVAFVAEFGLDVEQQSALNLIHWASGALSRGVFANFRDNDARYTIAGGNTQLAHRLAQQVEGQIQYGKILRELRRRDHDYLLTLDDPKGNAEEVRADIVVLALPFSVLRDVKLDLPLSSEKRKAIEELGYGTHARLLCRFNQRVWAEKHPAGELLTDAPLQHCWDHTYMQNTSISGLSISVAGRPGLELAHDRADQQVRRLLVGLERAFVGARDAYADQVERIHWPTLPYSKGSLSCYRPGQWTEFAGIEGNSEGRIYFAGEHCSAEFRGTMNGAVQSGRRVAEEILSTVRAHA